MATSFRTTPHAPLKRPDLPRPPFPAGYAVLLFALVLMPVVAFRFPARLPLPIFGIWGTASILLAMSAPAIGRATYKRAGQKLPSVVSAMCLLLALANLGMAAYTLNRAFA